YEVFINEYPIILTNTIGRETDFKLFLLDTFSIEEILKQFHEGCIAKAHIYYPDAELLIKKFRHKIPAITAAGGLVRNAKGEILFIYRNGKWDLPKGKLNRREITEQAAVREVEEETGVKGLIVDEFIKKTYHIFKNNGNYRFKETYWYAMHTDYDGALVPETKENIEEVVWKNSEQIREALKNSYLNIKHLLAEYH
ncbi:MAG: NUDIX domain-containing protein, partial [Sinomicrobium sp.]|nr:NUDIX domain-containing protein [Sinomicrobium sp.]